MSASAIRFLTRSQCDASCLDAIAQLERVKQDVAFLEEQRTILLQKYPEEWVAIFGGRVVSHDPQLPELLRALQRLSIDPRRTVVRFMSRRKRLHVL